jgi:hypothetical protein
MAQPPFAFAPPYPQAPVHHPDDANSSVPIPYQNSNLMSSFNMNHLQNALSNGSPMKNWQQGAMFNNMPSQDSTDSQGSQTSFASFASQLPILPYHMSGANTPEPQYGFPPPAYSTQQIPNPLLPQQGHASYSGPMWNPLNAAQSHMNQQYNQQPGGYGHPQHHNQPPHGSIYSNTGQNHRGRLVQPQLPPLPMQYYGQQGGYMRSVSQQQYQYPQMSPDHHNSYTFPSQHDQYSQQDNHNNQNQQRQEDTADEQPESKDRQPVTGQLKRAEVVRSDNFVEHSGRASHQLHQSKLGGFHEQKAQIESDAGAEVENDTAGSHSHSITPSTIMVSKAGKDLIETPTARTLGTAFPTIPQTAPHHFGSRQPFFDTINTPALRRRKESVVMAKKSGSISMIVPEQAPPLFKLGALVENNSLNKSKIAGNSTVTISRSNTNDPFTSNPLALTNPFLQRSEPISTALSIVQSNIPGVSRHLRSMTLNGYPKVSQAFHPNNLPLVETCRQVGPADYGVVRILNVRSSE